MYIESNVTKEQLFYVKKILEVQHDQDLLEQDDEKWWKFLRDFLSPLNAIDHVPDALGIILTFKEKL
jgi:hypothetical protein|tara:strand:+ start:1005 stop:1205 length:201 start_codon:yes stop_codon:yes gene_type:complete